MLTLCVYYELSKSANPAATKHLKQRACMKIHELDFTNHVQSSKISQTELLMALRQKTTNYIF